MGKKVRLSTIKGSFVSLAGGKTEEIEKGELQ